MLAGIHGKLRAQICRRRRSLVGGCCGTTPEHIRAMKVGAARRRSARAQSRRSPCRSLQRQLRRSLPSRGERSRLGAKVAAGEFVTMVEIVPPEGTDIRQGTRRRALPEIRRRGRHQHSRQPARLGAHEQPGAVAADSAAGRASKRFCTTPAATAMCSASSRICWAPPRLAFAT